MITEMELQAAAAPTTTLISTKQRYLALDVLRGMTIALMVLVNNPGSWGSIYAPFRHAAWHGFTITDLVFPSFLFVVGNAMSFSMRKFEHQSEDVFLRKILKRSFLIFAIGLLLTAFPFVYRSEEGFFLKDFSGMRIMGVLQRIALCYLVASLMVRYLKLKGSIILSAVILLGYWAVMYYFGDPAAPFSPEGNAALKFDLLVFHPDNLYTGFGFPFDPEGLLSTIPAIVNVIAGYVAGIFIQKSGNTFATVWKLAVAAVVFIVVAQFWDSVFPVNKPIWTSSYVLLTVGWSLMIISALILVIEVFSVKKWTYFFEVFGKNPLFIFVMSGVFAKLLGIIKIGGVSMHGWLFRNFYLSWLTNLNASLLFAISFVVVMWLMGYWMDRKKIYVKV